MSGGFSWTTSATALQLTVLTATTLATPGLLTMSIVSDDPGAIVDFTLDTDPTVIATVTLDASGELAGFTITIPLGSAGAHTLHAVSSSGAVADVDLTYTDSGEAGTDPDPSDYPDPPTVTRWTLTDPTTGGDTFEFPVNPRTADSVILPRALSVERTTHPDGQAIVFEGARKAKTWTMTGELLAYEDVQSLREWPAKRYKVYLSDDLGRTFVVRVLTVKPTWKRSARFPEMHTYTLTCLLYDRIS